MLKLSKTTQTTVILLVMVLGITIGCTGAQSQTETNSKPSLPGKTSEVSWDFDEVPEGELPSGWKVEATNQKGSPAIWRVIKDTTAPSGDQVLALVSPPGEYGGNFNLCWMDSTTILDGEIQVGFKSIKGEVDQGGGVMWRVRDKDNYYIARFNPLEDNFRIYHVHNGSRKKIADVKVVLPAGKWHTMKIVQQGNTYEGYINGDKLLEGTNDLFTTSGGVGLWTKADAVTSFDDFSVKPLKP